MDWKDVLRRRLASPNKDPKSECGRDRPLDSPPQARSGAGAAGRRRKCECGSPRLGNSPDKGARAQGAVSEPRRAGPNFPGE